MKLATYRDGTRDGRLVAVSTDLQAAAYVADVAPTMQAALDDWDELSPYLQARCRSLDAGELAGAFPFDAAMCMAPLPRAYQWADGSAYLNHVELVRKARGAAMPPELYESPLMYQGGSDTMLGANDPVACPDESFGIDFEAELAVITTDVPMGAGVQEAEAAIRLVMLVNDVSLRNLIPAELAKGFGFLQSKPASAFSPVAVTPDELGDAWREGRFHVSLRVHRNEYLVGRPDCGTGMHFSFPQLISHLCRTRSAGAGTIVGSGTVSNADRTKGYACIAEQRMIETIDNGQPVTAFLRYGESVTIEAFGGDGKSIFGAIRQQVVPAG
ncbi:MAG: fumarylacetoacetate hydrolase family protein [Burkholderiaceae bacterium]